MSGAGHRAEEDEVGAECVTHTQLNALRDTLQQEIQGTMANTQRDLEIEINQQFGVLRTNLVADIVRELRANPLGAQEVELDETDAETAERLARERRARRDQANRRQQRRLGRRHAGGRAHAPGRFPRRVGPLSPGSTCINGSVRR